MRGTTRRRRRSFFNLFPSQDRAFALREPPEWPTWLRMWRNEALRLAEMCGVCGNALLSNHVIRLGICDIYTSFADQKLCGSCANVSSGNAFAEKNFACRPKQTPRSDEIRGSHAASAGSHAAMATRCAARAAARRWTSSRRRGTRIACSTRVVRRRAGRVFADALGRREASYPDATRRRATSAEEARRWEPILSPRTRARVPRVHRFRGVPHELLRHARGPPRRVRGRAQARVPPRGDEVAPRPPQGGRPRRRRRRRSSSSSRRRTRR